MPDQTESTVSDVTLYYRTYKPCDWDSEHYHLNKIINDFLIPKPGNRIKLRMYFKPKKLTNCFSLRKSLPDFEKHGLVYDFQCPEDRCNASYIGHTSNKLLTRMGAHRYKPSNIHAHYLRCHDKNPTSDMFKNFKIIFMDHSEYNVKTAEALYIKLYKPSINKQFNDMALTLHIFN
jgi:hypothetical protein